MEATGLSAELNHRESECDWEGRKGLQQRAHKSWHWHNTCSAQVIIPNSDFAHCRIKSMHSDQGTWWSTFCLTEILKQVFLTLEPSLSILRQKLNHSPTVEHVFQSHLARKAGEKSWKLYWLSGTWAKKWAGRAESPLGKASIRCRTFLCYGQAGGLTHSQG